MIRVVPHFYVPFVPMFPLSLLQVFATGAIAFIVLLIFAALLLASYKHKRASSGELSPVGKRGVVEAIIEPEGTVIVDGEVWRACTTGGVALTRGTTVKVVGMCGLLLAVEADARDRARSATERRAVV